MSRRTYQKIALAVWIIPFLIIGIMVASRPLKRTVTPLYHEASANWWAGKELYQGPQGMNYLPHFAVLFSPFHALPSPVGDVLWRAAAMGLLAAGLWRFSRQYFGNHALTAFTWSSILILPICLGAFRNGQANAMFGAITLYAVTCLCRNQWWQSSLWMGLAFMLKPIGIVLMLLVPAVYPMMFLPVVVSFAGCLAFPFLFAAPTYVIAQHQSCFDNLRSCSAVIENRFADINGIIRAFGGELPDRVSKLMRVGAGGLFLGLSYFGGRRLKEQEPMRALWLYSLATAYLMLFNPMTEHNSYVILAPALGLCALWGLWSPQTRNLGLILIAMIVSMGILPTLLRPLFENHFALVWSPLMALVFLGLLGHHVFQKKKLLTAPPIQETES